MTLKIAYQGEPGANSHLAAREAFFDLEPVAYPTFEDALAAVKAGDAGYAMIPIENSVAGRVADIHHLLPNAGLYIVGEHFLRVRFHLMAVKGATFDTITDVYSHVHALGQQHSRRSDHQPRHRYRDVLAALHPDPDRLHRQRRRQPHEFVAGRADHPGITRQCEF